MQECADILNKGDQKYSQDEVKVMREIMYFLAESLIEIHKSQVHE